MMIERKSNSSSATTENVVCFSDLKLTKNEIIQTYSMVGQEFFMQIFLKDISSIQLHYKSYPILIVFALISLCAIFYDFATAGIILCLVFTTIFFVTRKYLLVITARGGEQMKECVNSKQDVKTFINEITEAKKAVQ